MNKCKLFFPTIISIICLFLLKVFHPNCTIRFNRLVKLGKRVSITVRKNSTLIITGKFVTRNNVEIVISNNAEISIGDRVFINSNCILSARKKISIGNNVQLGPNCLIYDNDHDYHVDPKERSQRFQCDDVIIGDDVWIGAGTIILKGTQIGHNCVIGAGSIVKGNIPDNTLYIQKRESIYRDIQ